MKNSLIIILLFCAVLPRTLVGQSSTGNDLDYSTNLPVTDSNATLETYNQIVVGNPIIWRNDHRAYDCAHDPGNAQPRGRVSTQTR